MKTILHHLRIHAPAPDVYRALTTQRDLSGWWTTRVEVEEGEGGLIRFAFLGDFHPEMRQVSLESPRRVVWKCEGGHPNWQDNTFTFTLTGEKGETGLIFVQDYSRELSDEIYGNYNFNWGYYLNSLKQLCETGRGTPFEPDA